MKRKYKLVAFDMDGTLLNSKKQISAGTSKAIQDAVAAGKMVALSTGRCLPELYEFLEDLKGVRYLICVSGGYIYDTEQKGFVYSNPIPYEMVKKILEIAQEEDCMVHILSDLSIVERRAVENLEHYHMGVYRPLYERVTTMVDQIERYYESQRPEAAKLNLYHSDVKARENTMRRLSELNIESVRSEITSAECSNKGVTKGTGLRRLCEHLSIPIEETIAVGDADNDLEILKTAGLSIAMGNAKEHVKAVCDVVVADNDHDGCAEVIYRYLLNGKDEYEGI